MKQIYNYSLGMAGILLLMVICTAHLNAQISTEACQTILHGLTYEQMRQDAALLSRIRNTVRGRGETASTDTVPVFFSVFRNDDGSFADPSVDDQLIRQALDQLNGYFAPIRLHFVQLGGINYIDNNALAGFSKHHHLTALSYVSTALNVYTKSGSGSFAQFPPAVASDDGPPPSLSSGTDRSNALSLNSRQFLTTSFAHEMGHSYGLLHTFEGARVYNNPAAPTPGYTGTFQDHPYGENGNSSCRELVIRQPDTNKPFALPNAAIAGDLVEDTPAFCVSTAAFPAYYPDVNGENCDTYPFSQSSCNGCIIVDCDYQGNYVDYNGDTLVNTEVSIRNLMSYTSCRSEFTEGQYERMAFYHQRARSLQYDAGLKINLQATVTFEDTDIPMDDIILQFSHPNEGRHSNVISNTSGQFQTILYAPTASARLLKPGTALNPNYSTSPWVQPDVAEIVANSYTREDWETGLDAQDLLLLRRHLNGELTLDGYHQLAADIDRDGRLTDADADLLQSFLAGSTELFSAYMSPWQFVPAYIPAQHEAAFQQDPFNMELDGIQYHDFAPYLEAEWEFNIGELQKGRQGFRAVKLGDLNGSSLRPAGPETCFTESLNLHFPTVNQLPAESEIQLTIGTGNDMEIHGFEFTLSYNSKKLQLKDIRTDGLPDFRIEDHVSAPSGESTIRVVWIAPEGERQSLAAESPLLHFDFTSRRTIGQLQRQFEVAPESRFLFLGSDNCLTTVQLEVSAQVSTPPAPEAPTDTPLDSPYAVDKLNCYPNPTIGDLTAVFKAGAGGKGDMTITDGLLRPLYHEQISLDKGLNEVHIDTQSLPAGLLIVMLQSEEGTFVRRVVKGD